ncbi:hypothetical protein [Roseivirga sp. E12]|uniref:hypothetical protein n=1 Tax=Roseivirga sp. E12 TaxID=2819237 RepID=UPI001ABC11FB|nr:hypothetical protein [Roseivirga sp. E12]MBO3699490.1 hypothetical protein [Roseivirga sp. E12]
MKRFQLLIFIPMALLLTYCAPNKTEPLYFNDGIVNLAGMWVANEESPTELDILFGVDLNEGSTDVSIMGETVKGYQMLSRGNQFMIAYETLDGRKFNILAQMKNENEMRITRTEEIVNGFMPLGQLGEKVYHLKRLDSRRAFVVTSNLKSKN